VIWKFSHLGANGTSYTIIIIIIRFFFFFFFDHIVTLSNYETFISFLALLKKNQCDNVHFLSFHNFWTNREKNIEFKIIFIRNYLELFLMIFS
jgi:hypothetical protein